MKCFSRVTRYSLFLSFPPSPPSLFLTLCLILSLSFSLESLIEKLIFWVKWRRNTKTKQSGIFRATWSPALELFLSPGFRSCCEIHEGANTNSQGCSVGCSVLVPRFSRRVEGGGVNSILRIRQSAWVNPPTGWVFGDFGKENAVNKHEGLYRAISSRVVRGIIFVYFVSIRRISYKIQVRWRFHLLITVGVWEIADFAVVCGVTRMLFTRFSRPENFGTVAALYYVYKHLQNTPSNIAIHVDDITLRAFEKYCVANVIEIYLQETFSEYFSLRRATWSRILRVHL